MIADYNRFKASQQQIKIKLDWIGSGKKATNLFLITFLFSFLYCGLNTDGAVTVDPAYYPYANTPVIFGLQRQVASDGGYQFQLNYFVTNTEVNFTGYNVYIANYPQTAESIIGSQNNDNLYMPRGVSPSFIHANTGEPNGSMFTTDMIAQVVNYHHPPPAATPFYPCQRYYFRMTAYLSNQLESLPSAQVSSCATLSGEVDASCPAGTSCAPF